MYIRWRINCSNFSQSFGKSRNGVDLFLNSKLKTVDKSRTIGISQNNIEYFTKYILNINPLLWKIKKIEIFNSNLKDKKLLNFKNKNQFLFSMIKNHELNDYLIKI